MALRREVLVAAVITAASAFGVVVVSACVHIGYDFSTLDRFGLSLSSMAPIFLRELWANVLLFPIVAMLVWSLSSWRLPVLASGLGFIALAAPSQLVVAYFFDVGWESIAVLILLAIGMNGFLRASDWIYHRFARPPLLNEIDR